MGNGPKKGRETAKPPAGAGTEIGGEAAPIDFCLRTHTVGVRLAAGVPPEVGAAVWLALAPRARVLGDDGELGVLDDPLSGSLTRCLVEGFRLSGSVLEVDIDGNRATITVTGEETS
jgi:hypothetical protein